MERVNMPVCVLGVLSLLSATLAVTPITSAHTCSAYNDSCDPNGCKDGEEHDHTRMHHFERDEHCVSHAHPAPSPICVLTCVPTKVSELIGPAAWAPATAGV